MFVPLLVDLVCYQSASVFGFVTSIFICGFFGSALALANRPHGKIVLGMREAFLVTAFSWIVLSLFAGLPFYCIDSRLSFISSWFESVSSLTTTGATLLANLDDSPKGLLLWRALLQWMGGTGIVVMAMTIFPTLRIGGMQLFRSEFSDRSEKILPRLSQIVTGILSIYVLFTVVCCSLLWLAGMSIFDAICHSMSAVSTGGLSTKDASIGFYDNPLIELIIMVFMILGGTTLILYIKLWNRDVKTFRRDSQLRAYLGVLLVASLAVTFWLWLTNYMDFITSLRRGAFITISTITTTGFTTGDYGQWGAFFGMFLFVLAMIGGCTGSTTGGIKIFRFQVLFALTKAHLLQLRRPHGVFVPVYQDYKISDAVAFSVFTFITLYGFCLVMLALALSGLGLDFVTSLSGSASCLSNTGLGLGKLIGPHTTFANLADGPKLIMMLGMILGRLELLTLLVLFMPSFWRD
ncbi:TrkH family potassium uptake protein [Candidatus Finniella inopinata]|uniref:Trk system potassium uptake protein n=1 Tax=Candidatus Finniella inopinata TaxID=1696036 RepID=A0A4Q7DKA0_9PROT|nr:TrkH family potassium uptake protein [Candidatus Finniella inopinata]RZI46494.1 TrkH family potassium uptake protein [Candidatus Finniella inopinata]